MNTPNINGVTLSKITSAMRSYERVINWYNRKYNYNMEAAPEKDRKDYEAKQSVWDYLKGKRDELKAAASLSV